MQAAAGGQETGGSVTGEVRRDRVGDVAVLVIAHPPVNALSAAVRDGLAEGLAAALADPEIKAIVLRGEGRGFCAGADIREFGGARQGIRLGALCLAIEAAKKPVIAALHGMALGGGLELALAAHYRVAVEGTVLGLPEVNLGLLPGAGGTQRLPRLVGAGAALRMMLSGVPIKATEAVGMGLVDRVVPQDALSAALALAGEGVVPRPTAEMRQGMSDGRRYLAEVAAARREADQGRLPAPSRIVDCVEAALLFPMGQGLEAEATAFAELMATPEAAGLRHAFFVERRATSLPAGLDPARVKVPALLGIWGAGEGVADLAYQALGSGMEVVLAAPTREELVSAVQAVATLQEAEVQAGRLNAQARDADWARLATAANAEGLDKVDLVLAASTESLPRLGVPVIALGASPRGVAVTVPAVKGGLAEMGLPREADAETAARLIGLARRLNWRLVTVGQGGPVELGLRLALDGAMAHLASQGMSAGEMAAARAAWLSPARGAETAAGQKVMRTCLAALAAEGARMLADGRARRPLQVDAVALMAGLVPRWQGGPMFQADQRGLLVLRRDLLAEGAPVFRPDPLIDRLIADGRGFAALN